jgi:3-dehydro-L-gulonate 2-dehydrogenase
MNTITISFETMVAAFTAAIESGGVAPERAATCARIIAQSTFDGIESHGIRRLLPLVAALRSGEIDGAAVPEPVSSHGAIEVWDGKLGIGPLNATFATGRAMALAGEHGIGCAGLRNTTHWLRAATYGRQAVESGFALICWTNTISNMGAWGAADRSVGNNPMVIAVPHRERPLVLDMAMSQYSLGSIHLAAERGKTLEVPGGYDEAGELSNDPKRIIESGRVLPAGFWKGSGLAILLDALAVLLTGGNSTAAFDRMGSERGVSQVFLAFDPAHAAGGATTEALVGEVTAALGRATPLDASRPVHYPGEGTLERRRRNMEHGVEVERELWERIERSAS